VPLLMLKRKLVWIYWTNLQEIQISTCFTLRRSGVPTVIPPMLEMFAYMLIIGRILGESPIFTTMRRINALNGKPRILCKPTLMDVKMNIDASTPMDGKNRNIILLIISFMAVDNLKPVLSLIAPTSTAKRTKDSPLTNILNYFQRIEAQLFNKPWSIKTYF
jgi:hypothetical protein